MTPAKLHALVEVDDYAHDESEQPRAKRKRVSQNPAADLMQLAGTQ